MTATQNPNTAALAELGVSIWLDDLSREHIVSGRLQELIDTRGVTGITTNPTIFAAALKNADAYADRIRELAAAGTTAQDAAFDLMTADVRAAADILRPIHDRTAAREGWVSIEVGADAAHDAQATIAEAHRLHTAIDRPNVFVKIPATDEGLQAITEITAAGISVNVTLIFSLARFRQVAEAYLAGLERAAAAGIDLAGIHSVSSLFVSRVDTEVDGRLDALGTPEAHSLRTRVGVAGARLAYGVFREVFSSPRAHALLERGAHPQRPLWASTGVKDASLPATHYVTELAAPDVIETMPEKTLQALAEHGGRIADAVTPGQDEARAVLDGLAQVGVDYDDAMRTLETAGVEKFAASGRELLQTVGDALRTAR